MHFKGGVILEAQEYAGICGSFTVELLMQSLHKSNRSKLENMKNEPNNIVGYKTGRKVSEKFTCKLEEDGSSRSATCSL